MRALHFGRGLLFELGNHAQRLPVAHAILPDLGLGIDDRQPEQIVELFERNDFDLVRGDLDVPFVVSVVLLGRVPCRPVVPAQRF